MDAKALAGALAVDEDDEIMMLTKKGQAIRCPVLNIRETNRGTKGVKLVDLSKGDKLIAISRVVAMQEGHEEDGEDGHEDLPVSPEQNNQLLEEPIPDEVIVSDEDSSSLDLSAENIADPPFTNSEESGDLNDN